MAQVLYRKYRSRDFSEIYGQDRIKKVLIQAIKDDKVAHAYLFTGPRGTGKTSIARILAKALNCTNRKNADPCNECINCKSINESHFMDLIEIDAASNRGIDEIRDLKEKVGFLPVQGTYKVYIIDEVHMLTSEAFNALLKTLEEPPSNVVFILATTEVHKLPQTIISRTQRFDFKLANDEQLRNKLTYVLKGEGIKFESDALDLIISAAGGSFRDAETILEKVLSSTGYKKDKVVNVEDISSVLGLASETVVEELIANTALGDVKSVFSIISSSSSEGIDPNQLIKQLLLRARTELSKTILGESNKYTYVFLVTFIKYISEAYEKLKLSLLPSLTLEMAILNIVDVLGKNRARVDEVVVKDVKSETTKKADDKGESGDNKKKPESKEKQSKAQNTKTGKTANGIQALWSSLIDKAKANNPHLAALLVNVVVKDVVDGVMKVEVPFGFHQKQLESTKIRELLSKMTREVFGEILTMEVNVNKELAKIRSEKETVESSNKDIVEEIFGELEQL